MDIKLIAKRAIVALQNAIDVPESIHVRAPTSAGNPMLGFTLAGDRVPNCGRAMVLQSGKIILSHTTLPTGLDLCPPFVPHELAGFRGGPPTRGHAVMIDDLERVSAGVVRRLGARRPGLQQQQQHADADVERAARADLESRGWVFGAGASSGGVQYANDGGGRSQACRLVAKNGIATVWSHRADLDLDAPWREGRDTADGQKTWYATGADLLDRTDLSRLPVLAPATAPAPVPVRDEVERLFAGSHPCPPEHLHLRKGIAEDGKPGLDGRDLRAAGSGERYAGSIIVPMLRPVGGGASDLEICGAQLLLRSAANEIGTDKIMLRGSQMSGAFLPLPAPSGAGAGRIEDWLSTWPKDKPIVLCEGFATALAVQQSGAGNAICCFSSANIGPVARWLAAHEHDQIHGIVIAADNDIGVTREGKLRSKAVPNAIAVAREVGAQVAYLGRSYRVGNDARDLWAFGGDAAVRSYIEHAQEPATVETRFNATVEAQRKEVVGPQR